MTRPQLTETARHFPRTLTEIFENCDRYFMIRRQFKENAGRFFMNRTQFSENCGRFSVISRQFMENAGRFSMIRRVNMMKRRRALARQGFKPLASAPVSAHTQRGASPLQAYALRPVAEGNCVAVRRGGKQLEARDQSAG
jgi:hypothetical protein